MATKKAKKVTVEIEPSTIKGTHLTVITDNFGKTTLIWDDEQLLKEVREAIASVEGKPKKKAPAKKAKVLNSIEESTQAIEKAKESSKKTVAKKAPAKKTTKGKTK